MMGGCGGSEEQLPPPVLLGLCLLLAVTVCSSAGAAFTALTTANDVPPFLAASWRFWCQEVVQLGPFLLAVRTAQRRDDGGLGCCTGSEADHIGEAGDGPIPNVPQHEFSRDKDSRVMPKFVSSLQLLATSGFFLGVHFAAWVYSLRHTSLVHSMLWVSMGPILINGGSWIMYCIGQCAIYEGCMRSICPKVQRPSWQETAGAMTGILGAILMLLDIGRGSPPESESNGSVKVHEPTFIGDVAAFIGAAAVSVYLIIGGSLRSWMPVWMYAFPVVGCALVTNLAFAFMYSQDRATWAGLDRTSVFGFLNGKYFLLALYLGVGPGICGHTMLNALLKYMSPLTISTAMLAEPILGGLIGYCLGMQPIPGMWTFLGGSVLLIGLLLVVLGESKSESGTAADDGGAPESVDVAFRDETEQELIRRSEFKEAAEMPGSLRAERQYGTVAP